MFYVWAFDTLYCLPGLNLTDFMPPLDSLLEAEELLASGLLDNAQFQFFLKAGYEQIERSSQNTDEMVE